MTKRGRTALRLRRTAVNRSAHVLHASADRQLRERKPAQRAAWARQAGRTQEVYAALAACGDAPGATPMWARYVDELSCALLPRPPWDFLRHPLLLETMLARGSRLRWRELRWLRHRLPAPALARALEEDPAGDPALSVARPRTSETALHHLYHLERLRAATGARASDTRSIVEWGGGYGGFARTVRRASSGPFPAHAIVDLPLVSALQWTYLTTVLGEDQVELALAPGHRPSPGKVTIVPASLGLELDVRPELFVSLWGLSEMSVDAQEAVAARRFLGADRLLLAFQRTGPDTPGADRVGEIARRTGCVLEPVGVLSHSSYAFR